MLMIHRGVMKNIRSSLCLDCGMVVFTYTCGSAFCAMVGIKILCRRSSPSHAKRKYLCDAKFADTPVRLGRCKCILWNWHVAQAWSIFERSNHKCVYSNQRRDTKAFIQCNFLLEININRIVQWPMSMCYSISFLNRMSISQAFTPISKVDETPLHINISNAWWMCICRLIEHILIAAVVLMDWSTVQQNHLLCFIWKPAFTSVLYNLWMSRFKSMCNYLTL